MVKSSSKVPIQKGPIKLNQPTLKTMSYPERVADRHQELRDLKDGQTMRLMTPKT